MLLSLLCVLFVTVLAVNAQTYNCPEGWVVDQSNTRCYKFIFYPQQPYVIAAKACAEWYSILISVTSASEHSFLNEYLLTHDGNRNEWYTSGKKLENTNRYIWEGEGDDLDPAINWWMAGYQFMPGDRMIYKYDTEQNGYRWTIGEDAIPRAYICEISQEEAFRVLIQKRDFTFGSPFLLPEDASYGPTFEPDGVPEDVWFLSTTTLLYMECLAFGNPLPSYKWLKGPTIEDIKEEVSTKSDSRYILTNGKLSMQNPTGADSSYYRCEASNSQGTIISNYAQLSLGNLRSFSNVPDAAVTALSFEGAVISCSNILFEPTVVYNWERVSGGKSEDIYVETTPYIFISSNGRLYFSEVTQRDEGNYYCRVSLSGISKTIVGTAQPPSAISKPIQLLVQVQAAKSDWGPIIQDDFINAFPNPPARGQEVRLECFAYGSANGYKNTWVYFWSRHGGLPSKVKFADFNRVLILKNAQAEDDGVYTCHVTRGSASATKSFTLNLNTKPYFLMDLKHQHIDDGSQFTWQCLADGNPFPQYSWYRNGTLITANDPDVTVKNNILTIAKANNLKHGGMYQCGATNVLGQVFSSAQLRVLAFAPSFTKNPLPQSLSGAVNGNISIECRPEAAPKPSIKWSKRDRFGNINDLSVSVITGGTVDTGAKLRMTLNGDLIITNLQMDDEGAYICTATNDHGEDQSACQLQIESSTTLFRKPFDVYRYTQNVTVFIQCEASYDPDLDLIYVWNFNGKRIDMEKEVYFFSQSYNPVGLYIKPLQYYHAGKYECIALTPLNSVSAIGEVIVEGVPEAPSGLYADSGRITQKSIILYWTSGGNRGSAILEYQIMYNVKSEPGEWYLATKEGQRVFHSDTAIQDATVDTDKRTFILTSLLPWNEYTFKIRAKNIKGWGQYSLASSAYTTLPARPDINFNRVTLNISGGGGSVGDLTIQWNPLPRKYYGGPGLFYRVYWRRDDTQVWHYHDILSTENELSRGKLQYVVLVGDENFYLPYFTKIQPINDYGSGDNSTDKIIYSAEGMPVPAPKIKSCSAINATAMDIYWTEIQNTRTSVGGLISGFQVNYWLRDTNDNLAIYTRFIRFLAKDGIIPTHGIVIGLKYDSYTTFDVQVFNTAGLGPKSDSYSCETSSWPTTHYPTEIRVNPIDSTSVSLTWRGVTIETSEATIIGYKIFLWPANENFGQSFQYIANFMPTQYTLSNLEAGVVYSARIAAYSQGGDGKKSPTIHFAIAGGTATVIDQTVTEFSYLAASSISSSIVLLVLTSIFVFMLS